MPNAGPNTRGASSTNKICNEKGISEKGIGKDIIPPIAIRATKRAVLKVRLKFYYS